ncbi:MAG: radical SAM protein [Candidatus Heimdallarchaeota archaeon]|nr:radical SAM protein [Candidatus Heimdallarchaeota archaeon]
MNINISSIRFSSDVNGPGRRIVIWVQGCTLNCKGCFNEEQIPHIPKNIINTEVFYNLVKKLLIKYNCEGITFSGGEPLQQSKAVYDIIQRVKNDNYSIVLFTGYTIQEIENDFNPHIINILEHIDILISGRFKQNNPSYSRTWFDNPDKQIRFLSDRYKQINYDNVLNLEFNFNSDDLYYTGFLSKDDLSYLRELFEEEDVLLL